MRYINAESFDHIYEEDEYDEDYITFLKSLGVKCRKAEKERKSGREEEESF